MWIASLFALAYCALHEELQRSISTTTAGRALTLLGRNSLQVFAWRLGLWMCREPFAHRMIASGVLAQAALGALAVLSLFAPALIRTEYLNFRKHGMRPAHA